MDGLKPSRLLVDLSSGMLAGAMTLTISISMAALIFSGPAADRGGARENIYQPGIRRALARYLKPIELPAGEFLFRRGDPPNETIPTMIPVFCRM